MAFRTTGGTGGTQVTVTTLSQLTAAAIADGASIIFVQGSISGAAKVQVGSNKSIIGKTGSCMSNLPYSYLDCANRSLQPSPALALLFWGRRTSLFAT